MNYGSDVLSGGPRSHRRPTSRKVPAKRGLVVEEVSTGFVGAILGVEKAPGGFAVRLEDRNGHVQSFPLGPGFWIDGKPVELTRPTATTPTRPQRTASGSVAVPGARARVARGSRIWVEGKHDAQLVEKIWGDDLRIEGVVVEELGGLDDLEEKLAQFQPDTSHRVGVLADHIVSGSKETRIAQRVQEHFGPVVHVIGHSFIDIWQAVKPQCVGIPEWPTVPRGEDWKTGVCRRLGWPYEQPGDTGRAWAHILSRVNTIADLDHSLSGRVEELIDFVTVDPS